MKKIKLLGLSALFMTSLYANANVTEYINVANTNPLSPIEKVVEEPVQTENQIINREELLKKIATNQVVELNERERHELEIIHTEFLEKEKKEKDLAEIVLLIALGGILIAVSGVGAGMHIVNKQEKQSKIKI